ncbi:PKD domain-containing protein [Maribacter algicola]|uniref:PKD domain-containing protein n=1 Tax=Meishania litoralis TaxID=3434685 RepID=A0ACC7LMP0_9FLAO
MKKVFLFGIGMLFLISCNSDDGPVQTPTEPIIPVADFSASETDVETGTIIDFTDGSQHASSYEWTFEGGDPASSTDKNPSVTYNTSGSFSVSLKVTNDDGDDTETKAGYINVTDATTPPLAAFTATSTMIETGESIEFTDTSTGSPTDWAWDFEGGDPDTSTDQNPTVTYTTAGTYTVTLTVTNADGSGEEIKTGFITVTDPVFAPVADFSASATTITSGNDITFTDTSANEPTSWAWEFEGGSPSTSSEQNPTITYNNFGTYSVTLTATNSAGDNEMTKTGFITVDMQTASYTVTFTSNWNATNHPINFPANDHFSAAVGMAHKPGVTFFEDGELASDGIENMAETGTNSPLDSEIGAIVSAGNALSFVNGGSLPNGTLERTFTLQVTEEFSFVTFVSMIAPSPDWFVAIENIGLFDNGEFISNLTVDAISYDAGTDSGPNFTSANDDTDPAEPISLITTAPLGNGSTVNPPMAFFTFVRN